MPYEVLVHYCKKSQVLIDFRDASSDESILYTLNAFMSHQSHVVQNMSEDASLYPY